MAWLGLVYTVREIAVWNTFRGNSKTRSRFAGRVDRPRRPSAGPARSRTFLRATCVLPQWRARSSPPRLAVLPAPALRQTSLPSPPRPVPRRPALSHLAPPRVFFPSASAERSRPVMVLGTTNRPGDVDPAILRRLPRQFVVALPESAEQREHILRLIARKYKLAEGVDLRAVADQTAG